MGQRKGAMDKALATLDGLIEKSVSDGTGRLPNYKKLAVMAGVAPATMLKAVRRLRDQGLVSVSHGTGITLVSAPPSDERKLSRIVPLPLGRRWERLVSEFKSGILTGTYEAGQALPIPKELEKKYGVCYRTLKRTLSALESEGYIAAYKRTYRIVKRTPDPNRNTIVLVARGNDLAELEISTSRSREHHRSLERICGQSGLRIRFVPCFYIGTELQGLDTIRRLLDEASGGDAVLGFILWTVALDPRFAQEVLHQLGRSQKPVAVLDEINSPLLYLIGKGWPALRYFTMATSRQPGRKMARYLLSLGHRRAAWFCYRENDDYALARLDGMREEFRAAGIGDAVVVVTVGAQREQAGVSEAAVSDYQALLEKTVPDLRHDGLRYSPMERVAMTLADNVAVATRRQAVRDRLFPLLENLVRDRTVTAWVGCNDELAEECLDFLRIREIAVPQEVSVVGFDDSYDSIIQKLTSYNFNGEAYMNAVISHVLHYRVGAAPAKPVEPIEIDGFIVERQTTGKARM